MKFITSMDKEKTRSIELDCQIVDGTFEQIVANIGADVVKEFATDAIIIALQSNVRRWMKAGKSDDEITKLAAAWKPGVRAERVTKALTPDAVVSAFSKMSAEDKAALLEKLIM